MGEEKRNKEKYKLNVGDKFGELIVLGRDETKKRIYYKCKCSKCGKIVTIRKDGLIKRKKRGCDDCEKHLDARNGKHNKIYDIHQAMKQRCLNPNQKFYKNYGGRGIKICDEWLDYKNLKKWAINNGYREGLDLDRINNDGNYEPSNCRWISHKVNCNNRSTRKIIKIKGKEYTVEDIVKKYNLSKTCIHNRLKRGDKEEELIRQKGTRKNKIYA